MGDEGTEGGFTGRKKGGRKKGEERRGSGRGRFLGLRGF